MSLVNREECEARCRVCGRRWYAVVSWVNIPEEAEERCVCGGRAQLYPWRGENAPDLWEPVPSPVSVNGDEEQRA